MPFTLPGTYTSKADTGYGARIQIDFGGGLVDVLEIKSIKNNGYTVSEINRTHLLSPARTEELGPGMLKPGTIEVSGNFIGDATQLDIDTELAQKGKIFPFRIVASCQLGEKTYTGDGNGYIHKRDVGPFEPNKTVDLMFGIQTTGPILEAVA